VRLALVLVLEADDLVALLDELLAVGLLEEAHALRVLLGALLELAHEGHCDGHS